MAKFAIMQMFHLVAIFATNAILKLKRQYPGSVVPLAMFDFETISIMIVTPHCMLFCCCSPSAPCCTCRFRTSPEIAFAISPLSSGSYHDIVAAPEWVPVHLHRVQIGVGIAALSLASDRNMRQIPKQRRG